MIRPVRTFRRAPEPQKPILYPAGTSMVDVPPLARGISPMEYLDICIAHWKQTPVDMPAPAPMAAPAFGSRRRRA